MGAARRAAVARRAMLKPPVGSCDREIGGGFCGPDDLRVYRRPLTAAEIRGD